VFENPESQIVAGQVEDDVAFAPENQGLAEAEIEKRVQWALMKIGLLHKRSVLSSALSGGEKGRLALAGALAADAECLVLDEPTAMLDPEGRAEVESVLRDIHASGTTIVQISHRLEDVIHADRVLVLSQGSWIWQGNMEDFRRDAKSLGYKLPPMPALRHRLALRGITSVETIEDVADAIARMTTPSACGVHPSIEGNKNPRRRESNSPLWRGGAERRGGLFFDIRNLSHSFNIFTPIETRVLRDISCVIPRGRWTSVLGRTGSGKSTLIQHLNGLYGVQSGEIFIYGEDTLAPIPVKGNALRELRRRVGLVFQSPEDQLFSPTVREELAFAPMNWGFTKEDIDTSVELALESVGLGKEYLDRSPLRLSGGERRLVAIASVLSAQPECLILDEPTAGLDVKFRENIIVLLSRLRDMGKTIIAVTHDFEMAFEKSDHFLVMDNGRKIYEGSIDEVLPVLLEMEPFMLPEEVRLSASLRKRGLDFPLSWKVEEVL